MRSASFVRSVEDVEVRAPSELARGGVQQGPYRLRGAAILADDLAYVFPRNRELDPREAVALDLPDLNAVGLIHERSRDERDEVDKG
jgi:hypothetical protein